MNVMEVTGPDWLSLVPLRDCHPQRGAEDFLGQKLGKVSVEVRAFLAGKQVRVEQGEGRQGP